MKAINNCYFEIARHELLKLGGEHRLTDSKGIKYLVDNIVANQGVRINSSFNILDLTKEYASLIPIKSCKFLANIILKGYVVDEISGIPRFMVGGAYASFKENYREIYTPIVETYGDSFKEICTPRIYNDKIDLQISDVDKSLKIINSLAENLKLLFNGEKIVIERKTVKRELQITDFGILVSLLIGTLLYSIRNKSVHGNVTSRLISLYANDDSVKNSVFVYFLAHFVLTLALYGSNQLEDKDLKINADNLKLLKALI